MPSLIVRMRKQDAVYWAPAKHTRHAKRTFEEPIAIKCRWVDQMREVKTPEGKTFVCQAIVYVDRVLELQGYLKQATLASLTSTEPLENTKVFEIQMTKTTPKLRNQEQLLAVYL